MNQIMCVCMFFFFFKARADSLLSLFLNCLRGKKTQAQACDNHKGGIYCRAAPAGQSLTSLEPSTADSLKII